MSEVSNVKLKRRSYFVVEAIKLIREEGIENLSARTVAQKAGFNTSSIYTYFSNMEHLESLACIEFTKDYLLCLDKEFKDLHTWIERYIAMWELFLKYSFHSPREFVKVFYPTSREPWTYELYNEYFAMFPEEIIFSDKSILKYLTIGSTERGFHRDQYLLTNAVIEGSVDSDKINYITEMNIAYTYYIISDVINGVISNDSKLYYKCLSYIIQTMLPYISEDFKPIILEKQEIYQSNL